MQSSTEYDCDDEMSDVSYEKKMELYSQPDLPQTLNHRQNF